MAKDETGRGGGQSRRTFIKTTAAAAGLYWLGPTLIFQGKAIAAIPGGSLDPTIVPKFTERLVIPPAMPATSVDYYEIAVRQFRQEILPHGHPLTTVWSYGSVNHPGTFNYPAFTIEAAQGTPVRVKWVNDLKGANGKFLPHLLPVDPTLHWANPPGPVDTRPSFQTTPGPYTGPVPIVTHLHGAAGVGDESDGYPEAWYLPAANNLAGFTPHGTWYDFFRNKANTKFGVTWGPGFAVFQYPNSQRASTLWYHDHTLGMTRLNVYAGPAGFYIIRGGPGDRVIDSRTGADAVLPGPAPAQGDPAQATYYEIPLAIQDRSFNKNGSLFYPDSRAFFDGITGPFIPITDVSPIWNPEFFGNFIVVNGRTWPFQTVEKRRYRFRFLNGCNSRFLILDFSNIHGVEVWQIGNEGGLLVAPVKLEDGLLIAPAERADIIVDFTSVPVGNYVLGNVGPDEPFGGGVPGVDFPVADPASTGQVMEFRVIPAVAADPTTPPQYLQLPAITALGAGPPRRLALLEESSTHFQDAPVEAELGTFDPALGPIELAWADPITENPGVGDAEVWEFYNFTEDAHPIHIHEVHFQVVSRQPIDPVTGQPLGPRRGPEPNERGFKDTVTAYPAEATGVKVKFETAGNFVWHCHIVEHEDNEMMRPYRIGPIQPGSPE